MAEVGAHLHTLLTTEPLTKQAGPLEWLDEKGSKIGMWTPKPERIEAQRQRNVAELGDLALLGGISFTLPFMIKAMKSRPEAREEKKRMKRMREAASAEHPYVSMDPDLSDAEEEARLSRLGLVKRSDETSEGGSESKEGFEHNLVEMLFEQPFGALKNVFGVGDKSRSDMYPTLATIALATGMGTGAYLAGKQTSKSRANRLDKKLSESRNKLDKVQYEALASRRPDLRKQSNDDDGASLWKGGKQMIPLFVAALAYGGWKTGRHLGKQSNPQRQAYEELKDELDNRVKRNRKPASLHFSPEMKDLFGSTRPDAETPRRPESRAAGSASLI